MIASWFIAAIAAGTLLGAGPHAHQNARLLERAIPPGTPFGYTTTPGSARTLVTALTTTRTDGTRLELLVVWRGTDGWYMKGAETGTSAGGTGSRFSASFSRGETTVSLDFWGSPRRRVRVSDIEVDLGTMNVLLVDQVDSPAGPRISKMLQIASVIRDPKRLAEVISQSEEVVTFLQCEGKLPSPAAQANVGAICAALGK